jgi:hypothetical protein
MLPNDATAAQYVGDGADNLHDGVIQHLAGPMLSRPAQGISHGPQSGSRPFEDQPVDDAEAWSYQTAQNAYRSANGELASGSQGI